MIKYAKQKEVKDYMKQNPKAKREINKALNGIRKLFYHVVFVGSELIKDKKGLKASLQMLKGKFLYFNMTIFCIFISFFYLYFIFS